MHSKTRILPISPAAAEDQSADPLVISWLAVNRGK